jgi:hypothetical protein
MHRILIRYPSGAEVLDIQADSTADAILLAVQQVRRTMRRTSVYRRIEAVEIVPALKLAREDNMIDLRTDAFPNDPHGRR